VSSWSSEMQKLLQNVFMTNEIFVDSGSGFSRTLTLQDTQTIQKQPVFPHPFHIFVALFSLTIFLPQIDVFIFYFFKIVTHWWCVDVCGRKWLCGCAVSVWVCCDVLLNLQLCADFKPLGILFVLNKSNKRKWKGRNQESGMNSVCGKEVSCGKDKANEFPMLFRLCRIPFNILQEIIFLHL